MTKSVITARMRCAYELKRERGKIKRKATDGKGGKGGFGGLGLLSGEVSGSGTAGQHRRVTDRGGTKGSPRRLCGKGGGLESVGCRPWTAARDEEIGRGRAVGGKRVVAAGVGGGRTDRVAMWWSLRGRRWRSG